MFPHDVLIDQTLGDQLEALAARKLGVRLGVDREEVLVQGDPIGECSPRLAPWTRSRLLDVRKPFNV